MKTKIEVLAIILALAIPAMACEEDEMAKLKGGKEMLVGLLLDESGSMGSREAETISGFNEYIQTLQNKKKTKIRFNMWTFNSIRVKPTYQNEPIDEVVELTTKTYRPDSGTPLYDAIAKSVSSMACAAKEDQPVLFVILTDGEENASTKYSREEIFRIISDKQNKDDWTFVYLGANQDSWNVAGGLGFMRSNVANYGAEDIRGTMNTMAVRTSAYSASYAVGATAGELKTKFFDGVKDDKTDELIK